MPVRFSESQVDVAWARTLKWGVIGYGSQGHAHAQNLRDSGFDVTVALPESSRTRALAVSHGFVPVTTPEAVQHCDALMFCTADVPMSDIYREEVAPHLRAEQALLFCHGFNVHYQRITPPPHVDVVLVAPKGPGPGLRSQYQAGSGLPALVGVHQDATGRAQAIALAYAWGLGSFRAVVYESSMRIETETDLFGEQAVLVGGVAHLVKAAFETLVEAGYPEEAAYFECMHELKLVVDLLHEGGLSWMDYRVSDTAEWGGYVSGPRVVGPESRRAMRDILREIQSGEFAREFIAENATGLPRMRAYRLADRTHPVEPIGREVRADLAYLDDKLPPDKV